MKIERLKDKTSILTCQRFSTSQLSNQTDKLRCRSRFAHYNTIERQITLMRAYLKTSLTILGPSPRYFCTNSDPTTLVGGVCMITTWWQNQRRGSLSFYCKVYINLKLVSSMIQVEKIQQFVCVSRLYLYYIEQVTKRLASSRKGKIGKNRKIGKEDRQKRKGK